MKSSQSSIRIARKQVGKVCDVPSIQGYLKQSRSAQQLFLDCVQIRHYGEGEASFRRLAASFQPLESCILHCNGIGAEEARLIADISLLGETSKLQNLSICYNRIGSEGVEYIAKALLRRNFKLKSLSLRWVQAGPTGALELAQALKANHTLVKLNLDQNGIGDEGCAFIAKALLENSTLRSLRLGGNRIGDSGAHQIFTVLAQQSDHSCKLESLYLQDNQIGFSGARSIAEPLLVNKTLKLLHLSRNLVGESGSTQIAKSLVSNNTLEALYLSGNQIGDEGAKQIALAMKKRKMALQVLSLGGNGIRDNGARSLADAAHYSKLSFKKVNLSGNQLGPVGTKIVAAALASQATVERLSLARTLAVADCILPIADLLKSQCCSLSYLNLQGNLLGDQGAAHIFQALKHNSTLRQLNVCETGITPQSVELIVDTISCNSSLVALDLFDNNLGSEGVRAISEAMKSSNLSLSCIHVKHIPSDPMVAKTLELVRQRNCWVRSLVVNGSDTTTISAATDDKTLLVRAFPEMCVSQVSCLSLQFHLLREALVDKLE